MNPPRLSPAESAALTRRVTLLSVATAAVLVTIKFAAWLASGSTALLASMADSGLDLIASLATAYAVRFAATPPDAGHRFGHGKAEAFASLMQAGLVFASAALVLREAAGAFLDPKPVTHGTWAVAVMLVSILLTGLLVAAQTRMLRQASSVAVSGDRAHYVSDLASNLVALAGVAAAAWLGVSHFDSAAAVVVAGLLLWSAVGVFREAANQLMDHELPDDLRAEIVRAATADARLSGVHQLRTRAAGPYIHIQMHVDIDPDVTLEAAHEVVAAAEARILEAFPGADIIIHADPRGRAEVHAEPYSAEGATQ